MHIKFYSGGTNTANIILPGLVIKQRWTALRLQAKWYSNSLNCIMLVEATFLISPKLNSLSLLYFACRRAVCQRLLNFLSSYCLESGQTGVPHSR